MASSYPLSSVSFCSSVWFHLLPRPVLLPPSTSIFLLEFSLSNSLRRSPRLCQLSLPTCKRHKNLLKMHRFQSLFPLLPHSPIHPPSRHPLLFPPPLFSSYTFLSLSYNSTSLFVSLTVLNSSRVGMAAEGEIFPITFQYNAYKEHALIQDLAITNRQP